jgi:regulatory protein
MAEARHGRSKSDLRRRALDLLARREHSVAELRGKLISKGVADDDVLTAVLEGLVTDGLLSDHRFAESFIRARRERGQGPLRIETELRSRGVAGDVIESLLDIKEAGWRSAAREARRKRFGDPVPSAFSERARQARFLRTRGFSEEQVRGALQDDGLE